MTLMAGMCTGLFRGNRYDGKFIAGKRDDRLKRTSFSLSQKTFTVLFLVVVVYVTVSNVVLMKAVELSRISLCNVNRSGHGPVC